MGMSYAYGALDDQESLATLDRALELGINFWDTADMYADGMNEQLLSRALAGRRDKVFLATKFGIRHRGTKPAYAGTAGTYIDGSPAWARQAVEGSLRRLGTDVIDLYYLHRVDPTVPIEDTVGAMADLVREGKVRYLGLSEASAATLRRACAVHPIAALQSEYSLLSRDVEGDILDACRALGVTLVAYSPLSRGLVTATLNREALQEDDFRRTLPRFDDSHWEDNRRMAGEFAALAATVGCSPAQLALAWVLAQGENIIPIPGTKKRRYLEDNAGAADLVLQPETLERIAALLARYPQPGPRYSESVLRLIDR